MWINQDQCNSLLAEGVIDKINKLFSDYGLTEVRLFKPQLGDQNGIINLIVKDSRENDYYTISRVKHKLKKIFGREDIDFLVEDNVDEEVLPLILRDIRLFSPENIQTLLPYHISVKDDEDMIFVTVCIKKEPGMTYDPKQLMSTFETATENEIENKSNSNTNIVKAH